MSELPSYGYKLCSVGRNILKRGVPRTYPQKKIDLGKQIVRVVEENPKVLVLHYNALDAKEWTDFRYDMKQHNLTVKVFPNKLTCKFLSDTMYKNMAPLFRTDTAVAYGDEIDLKKVLMALKSNSKVQLIGGKIDSNLFNRQQVEEYSILPNLEQARGELIQILQHPSQTISRLLQSNQSKLSLLLKTYVDEQSEANR